MRAVRAVDLRVGAAARPEGGLTARELLNQAQERLDRHDTPSARALALWAITRAGPRELRSTRARALTITAVCDRLEDRYAEGTAASLAAISLAQMTADLATEARARAGLARILISVGEAEEAVREARTALEVGEASGDLTSCMIAMTAFANVCIWMGQLDVALPYCERASEIARMLGDDVAAGMLMDTTACVYGGQADQAREKGDLSSATELYGRAAELSGEAMLVARRNGHRRFEANALANFAEQLAALGREEEGLRLLASWQIDRALDTAYTITHHLDTRGRILLGLGRYDEAAVCFTEALAQAEGKGTAMGYHEHLAKVFERNGDPTRALEHYKAFHALYVQVASEAAQRGARVTAVRWETAQAQARAEQERARAEALTSTNVELSRQTEDLLQQSREDPLTGLANRRAMERLLEAGLGDRAIAMLDVDHFKRVNDEFSHPVGDAVLRRLGQILRASCRAGDTAIRYGGEEFALLLHRIDEESAEAAAERVRAAVAGHDWDTVAPGLAITVSVGVASAADAATPVEVLAIADQRLYRAKRSGRNRVESSSA
jgi:diguanylate cyclase (GGDEF)-like protein